MKVQVRSVLPVVFVVVALSACGGTAPLPEPRNVIVFSGERIRPEPERVQAVEEWLRPQLEDVENNPSFLIRLSRQARAAYPWDTLEITGDTALILVERAAVDADTPHLVYAHFRLMAQRGELEEWIPGLDPEEELPQGFELERMILQRVSDVWLLGRSVYDTHAYGPLDELLYANERGLLTEYILATQGDRFPEQRERYTEENPEWEEALTTFFRTTFERDGPAYLPGEGPEQEPPINPG